MRFWPFLLLLALPALGQGLLLESDLVQTFELAPGEEAVGVLRLRNTGKEPLLLEITLADYREEQGFLPLGEAPRSLGGGGLSPEAGQVLLAPGEARDVAFRVRAPGDLVGTRYAALLLTPAGGSPDGEGAGTQVGLRVVQRYGVLVLVSHGGEPQVVFRGARVGEGRLLLEGVNQGNRHYYPRVSYQVVGPQGVAARGDLGTFLFLPGEPKRLLVPLPSLSPGAYQVVVLLDDGLKAYAVRTRLDVR
ncbi:MAG: hypothetical protein ACK4G4_08135 [Thermus sp.]|uniref:hypothetical protein n=1 Tax=Thermus sp. TaxID=275 RepID=UPI00391AA13D